MLYVEMRKLNGVLRVVCTVYSLSADKKYFDSLYGFVRTA